MQDCSQEGSGICDQQKESQIQTKTGMIKNYEQLNN